MTLNSIGCDARTALRNGIRTTQTYPFTNASAFVILTIANSANIHRHTQQRAERLRVMPAVSVSHKDRVTLTWKDSILKNDYFP